MEKAKKKYKEEEQNMEMEVILNRNYFVILSKYYFHNETMKLNSAALY